MTKSIYTLTILTLLFFISCSSNSTKKFNYEQLGSDKIFNNKLINGAELVFLDKGLELFSRDLILEKFNNLYYLFDTKFNQIIIVDSLGKLVKKIDKSSNLDYKFIKDITLDKSGTLYLLCNEQDRIISFDSSYNTISIKDIPIM